MFFQYTPAAFLQNNICPHFGINLQITYLRVGTSLSCLPTFIKIIKECNPITNWQGGEIV